MPADTKSWGLHLNRKMFSRDSSCSTNAPVIATSPVHKMAATAQAESRTRAGGAGSVPRGQDKNRVLAAMLKMRAAKAKMLSQEAQSTSTHRRAIAESRAAEKETPKTSMFRNRRRGQTAAPATEPHAGSANRAERTGEPAAAASIAQVEASTHGKPAAYASPVVTTRRVNGAGGGGNGNVRPGAPSAGARRPGQRVEPAPSPVVLRSGAFVGRPRTFLTAAPSAAAPQLAPLQNMTRMHIKDIMSLDAALARSRAALAQTDQKFADLAVHHQSPGGSYRQLSSSASELAASRQDKKLRLGKTNQHSWLVIVAQVWGMNSFMRDVRDRWPRFRIFTMNVSFWRMRLRAWRRSCCSTRAQHFFRKFIASRSMLVRYCCLKYKLRILRAQQMVKGHGEITWARKRSLMRLWNKYTVASTVGSAKPFLQAYKRALSAQKPLDAERAAGDFLRFSRKAFQQGAAMVAYHAAYKQYRMEMEVAITTGLTKIDNNGMKGLLAANAIRFRPRHHDPAALKMAAKHGHTPSTRRTSSGAAPTYTRARGSCTHIYQALFQAHSLFSEIRCPDIPVLQLLTGPPYEQHRETTGKLTGKLRKHKLTGKLHKRSSVGDSKTSSQHMRDVGVYGGDSSSGVSPTFGSVSKYTSQEKHNPARCGGAGGSAGKSQHK
jgi:hypothetical protein